MVRQIIKINEELCNGCGLCVNACHEGAIGIINGKAMLLREDYCDGLGNCLPVCPTGAISFETREAAEFNQEAVNKNMKSHKANEGHHNHVHSGCPGSRMMKFHKGSSIQIADIRMKPITAYSRKIACFPNGRSRLGWFHIMRLILTKQTF